MLQVIALVLSVSVSAPAVLDTHRLLTSPTRHVRALTPELTHLLAQGARRSPTFAQLLRRLEHSDVIVQIVPSATLKPSLSGRMLLVNGVSAQRYVRIEVRMRGREEDVLTVIGHELRHAVELADAPSVRDDDSLIRHYRRIGHSSTGVHAYDTTAALKAGQQVRREVGG